MSLDHLPSTAAMGPQLQQEVEAQLLQDLLPYDIDPAGLRIDWSEACPEGHCTHALDGNLEELSSVAVVDPGGAVVAEGWMDFIHGGGEQPLFVFWLFLSDLRQGRRRKVKADPHIPAHIWARLSEATRHLLAAGDHYDARWKQDPLVAAWRREHAA